MRVSSVSVAIVFVLCVSAAASVSAQGIFSTYERHTIVGRFYHSGAWRQMVCSTSGGSDGSWQIINTGSALSQSPHVVNYFNGSGLAYMWVVRANGYVSAGGCSGDWRSLPYGTQSVTLEKAAGTSTSASMASGWGPTDMLGGSGNDSMVHYGVGWSFGPAGRSGADTLVDLSGYLYNTMEGGSGSDCLNDVDGSALIFDCGSGSPDFWVSNGPWNSGGNCTHPVSNCL